MKITVEVPEHVVATIKQILKEESIKYTSEELRRFLASDVRVMYGLAFEINLKDAVRAFWGGLLPHRKP